VDLIGYLARRREPAQLAVIGTYRPADLGVSDNPLTRVRRELNAHGLCHERPLELLAEADVAAYVDRRRGAAYLQPGLARRIYERSDGNPLFMVHLAAHHIQQPAGDGGAGHADAPDDVPESLQQVIEQHVAGLPDDVQQVLEVGSVAGSESAGAQLAAALDRRPDALEDVCDEHAHDGRFLREVGAAEWPCST